MEENISSSPKSTYWPGIDGLRTVAFLLVFLHHCGKIPSLVGNTSLTNALNQISAWGWLGVDLFFVISGFLITSLLLREDRNFGNISLSMFYTRRILRIWPPYFTVILIACFLVPLLHSKLLHHFGSYFYHASLMFLPYAFFVSNLTQIASTLYTDHGIRDPFYINAIAAFWKENGVNDDLLFRLLGPTWSLCVEEQFYVAWPLCLIVFKSFRTRTITLVVFISCSIALRLFLQVYFAKSGHIIWYLNTFSHMDPLMIGALMATCNYYVAGLENFCKNQGFKIFIVSMAVLTATIFWLPDISMNELWMTPAITWCAAALAGVIAVCCYWPPSRNLFSNKAIVSFGKKTYTMYLWHYFCLYQVFKMTDQFQEGSWLTWATRATLSLLYTYLLAMISWVALEVPMNKIKRKFERASTISGQIETTIKIV